MLVTVAAAYIKKVQIKKYSVFIYSEAEPHAWLCTLYINRRVNCVFYSMCFSMLHCESIIVEEALRRFKFVVQNRGQLFTRLYVLSGQKSFQC